MTTTLNGNEIYATYGAVLCDGALDALFKPAPMKDYVTNKSAGSNGKTVLTGYSKIDERSLSLEVAITATTEADYFTRLDAFIAAWRSSAVALLAVSDAAVSVTFRLCYEDCGSYQHFNGRWGKVTLKLTEPNPTNRA